MEKNFFSTKNLTMLAVLSALIVVLQTFGSLFTIAGIIKLSFVLVPIVVGSILTGVVGGAFLGFVFGLVTLIMGIVGSDYFTFILFSDHPFITTFLCLFKGTMAGVVSGLLFKAIKNHNDNLAVTLASLSAPIVNTGLFIIIALFMSGTLEEFIISQRINANSVIYFLIIDCAGINFIVEFLINIILSPIIYRVIKIRW